MNKDDCLLKIAKTGYNVGFGAKKHFATYDMIEKIPGFINFLSLAIGTYALVFKTLSTETISATFIVLGIVGLYINFYDADKKNYERGGIELTKLFNDLERLYRNAKNTPEQSLAPLLSELSALETHYYTVGISKQILFSDWWAHYKFFWQHQIDWVDEQLNFNFFRDKVPLSFTLALCSSVLVLLWAGFCTDIHTLFCAV